MTQLGRDKASRKELVTVDEAAKLLDVSERTIRRMVKDQRLQVVRDGQRGVWIDVQDIQQKKNTKVRSAFEDVRDRMQQQLDEQARTLRELQEEVHRQATIISTFEEALTMVGEGTSRHLMLETGEDGDASHLVPFPDITSLVTLLKARERDDQGHTVIQTLSPLEKRHLPAATLRLVHFAMQHGVTVDDIKSLFAQGHIQLTVVSRGEYARRNKQEWWIRPEQQRELIRYWDEQNIAYTRCQHCPHACEDERMHVG